LADSQEGLSSMSERVRFVIRFVRVLLFHFVAQAYCTTLLYTELSPCNRFGRSSSSNSRNGNVGSMLHSRSPTYSVYSETLMAPVIPLLSSAYRDLDNSIFRNIQRWFRIDIMSLCIGLCRIPRVRCLAHQLRVRLHSASSACHAV
jgi:hypothetical protein